MLRIISQDGLTDVPYDGIILSVVGSVVCAYTLGKAHASILLGEYDSHEDAVTAMREVPLSYPDGSALAAFRMPSAREVKEWEDEKNWVKV